MKIGVILDGMRLARWQADALQTLAGGAEFIIYSCTSHAPAKRRARHAFYYLLNLVTVRNPLTREIALPETLPVRRTCTFKALTEGSWQRLPPEVHGAIEADGVEVLIKFGMGLLRVPPPDQLEVPILSYHHGDPSRFRGRPAGFYELFAGERVVGQVLQLLSDRLDAGELLAAAETKAFPHSYRRTLMEAYRHSPLLLRTAVANAVDGKGRTPLQVGPAYRLPGNALVLRFVARLVRESARHLLYGLFRHKQWSVATAPLPDPATLESVVERLTDVARWKPVSVPKGYRFLADPFFHPHGGLLVEGMSAASARGQILHLTGNDVRRASGRGGHFSYPAVVSADRRTHVVPEISEWSAASAYPMVGNGLGQPAALRIAGGARLLDPTPFRHGNTLFLFGNIAAEGPSVLRLWMAEDMESVFAEHPASPIRISPNGGRMAGSPAMVGGRLLRIGQDLRGSYGDGITVFHVIRLDRQSYAEEPVGELRFKGPKGPHTLNFSEGEMAFDYYKDALSSFAWLRRLRERWAARRIGD
jgi:hypothetical protein